MRLGSEANGQLQRDDDGGQMIAYLVNQTAYPAKKAHSNDLPSRQFSPIGPFWAFRRMTNFPHSPNVWFDRLNGRQLTMAMAH